MNSEQYAAAERADKQKEKESESGEIEREREREREELAHWQIGTLAH